MKKLLLGYNKWKCKKCGKIYLIAADVTNPLLICECGGMAFEV